MIVEAKMSVPQIIHQIDEVIRDTYTIGIHVKQVRCLKTNNGHHCPLFIIFSLFLWD